MHTRVTIIVVTYNNEMDIVECLGSLLSQRDVLSDIVVMDNASADNTVSLVESRFATVKVKRNSVNLGYAEGINRALDEGISEYVAVINADTLSESSWISRAILELERNPGAGICQPKILLYDNRSNLNSRGNEANFLFFGWPDGYGSVDPACGEVTRKIPFPSGCALVCRAECMRQLEGFDESYFMYGEDLDFGLRAFLMGWDVVYSPSSTVFHKYRFRESPSKYYLLERNRITTLLKTYKLRTLATILPSLVVAEIGVVSKAWTDGWIREKVLSYGAVLQRLPSILGKRKVLQAKRRRSDSDLIRILKGGLQFEEFDPTWHIAAGNRFLDKYYDFLTRMRL